MAFSGVQKELGGAVIITASFFLSNKKLPSTILLVSFSSPYYLQPIINSLHLTPLSSKFRLMFITFLPYHYLGCQHINDKSQK